MKRLLGLIIALCIVVTAMPTLAQEVTTANNLFRHDSFWVEKNGDIYTITGIAASLESDEITVPHKLNGWIYGNNNEKEYLFDESYMLSPEAFKNCTGVRKIEFEKGIAVIPRGLCDGMTYLEEVVLPESVKTIENEAFKGCENLKTIDLSNVENIGRSAFEGCKSLETVTLSASIEYIGGYAFYGCETLKTVNGLTEDFGLGQEALVGTLVVPYNEEPSQSDDDAMVFDGGYLYLGQSAFKNPDDIVELTVDALSWFPPEDDPESEKYDFTTGDAEIIKKILAVVNGCRCEKVYYTLTSEGTTFLITVKYADGTEAYEAFKESTIRVGKERYRLISEDYWSLAECLEGVKKGMAESAAASVFTDVATDDEYYEAMKALSELGIMQGYDDGTFKSEGTLTRAEAAAIMVRLLNLEEKAQQGETIFTDVEASHWASGYINVAVEEGIINGQGDGTFAPEEKVTYQQMVKMLVCALGYEPVALANGGWNGGGYLAAASKIGLITGIGGTSSEAVSRGKVAELCCRAFYIDLMEESGEGIYKVNEGKTILTEYRGIE